MPNSDSILILITVGILLFAIAIAYYQNRKQQELLLEQAEKQNGRIEKGNFLAADRLIVPVGNFELRIYSVPGGKNRPAKTIAELAAGSALFPKIKVGRNNLFQKALETFGQERFLLGDEDFDKTFVIQTEDQASARQLLTYEIQKNLLEMKSKSPSLEVGPNQFRLMVLRILKNSEDYDLFISTAVTILQKLG